MANSNFIETKSAIDGITSALDAQISTATKLNEKVIALNATYSKIPSEYLANQKQIAETNKAIAQSEKAVQDAIVASNKAKKSSATMTTQQKVDTQILNTEKRREATLTSEVAGEYRKLSSSVAIASEKYQNLIVRGRLANQTQREFNKELRTAQKEFRTLQTQVLSADRAVDKWNRTGQRSIGLGRDLLNAFGVVGGVTAFAMITRDIFQQTKEIMSLNNALKLVTDTQENYYAQQAFIARISEAYGVSINDLTKQFTQFYVSAKDKISSSEIQGIFESITKAGASMGLSVQSQERAFLALNQMMSKGTIQAEELRGQLGEALPGAFGIMAKAVGVTEKELAKMMKAGDLIASEVLPKFAKQLEITYGIENVKRVENLASAQNRLTNAWRNFVASLDDDGNKLSKFFADRINEITYAIKQYQIFFSSNETLRKKELDGIQESASQLAKKNLANISDADQRKQYANDRISELKDEAESINRTTKALVEKNKEIKSTQTRNTPLGEVLPTFAKNSIKQNEQQIANLNNQYRKTIGLIRGYATALESKKAVQTADNESTEKQIKNAEKLAKALEDLRQNDYNRKLSDLERELEIIQDNYDNKKNLGNDYILYAFQLAEKEMEIIKFKYDEEMRLAKLNGKNEKDVKNLEKIATNKYYTDQENAFKKHLETLDKIKVENGVKDTGKIADEEKFGSGTFILDPERYKGLIDGFIKIQEEAGKTKEEIAKLKEGFDNFFGSFTSEFLNNSGFRQLSQMFFEIDENGKTMFENLMEYARSTETVWDDLGVAFQVFAEIAQEVMNKLSEAEDAKLANTLSNLERERDEAIAFAGDSTTAREEIQRQFEERKHQAELKAFENKKKIAKANVIIDTAQAIVSLYAENNWVTATILGAILTGISLFQISQINAQQPPAYEFGTDNHIGGKMKINDQKGGMYKEAVQTPDGKIKVYNERNKILNAPKGTKVFTASETALMFNNDLNNVLLSNGISMQKDDVNTNVLEFERIGQNIVSAIQNKTEYTPIIDKNGFNDYVRNGNTIKQNMNNRFNGIGKNV